MTQILSALLIIILILTNSACTGARSQVKKRHAVIVKSEGNFVRQILLSGFILNDKKRLEKIVKPYQKKYLSKDQINQILQEMSSAYNEAGFAGLVNIRYELHKAKLVIVIDLNK
jgi:outer membrane protein assembly factor BamA